MQFIIHALDRKQAKKLAHLLLPSAIKLIEHPQSVGWYISSQDGTPLGCLVAWHEPDKSYLRSLYIEPTARRQHLARALVETWQQHARTLNIKELHCLINLPMAEQQVFSAFLQQQGFPEGQFIGEIFTFNPYNIIHSKFIQKTLARSTPFLPSSWRVQRYSELTEHDRDLLAHSKNTTFPEHFAYDLEYTTLELSQSFAFFCGDTVVGYITQSRLSRNSAFVPVFAANPDYRGAGLTILKYYMFAIHFETPEILQLRCHFTPLTTVGRELFLHYTQQRFSRHSLEFYFCKTL